MDYQKFIKLSSFDVVFQFLIVICLYIGSDIT